MSDAVEAVLNASELRSALRHELAHVRRRDNLKKLLLRCVVFPGMATLEVAWSQATEMAADDAAVSTASEALDLAAALIKLSRLATLPSAPDIATTLIHAPLASVNARIERLIAWNGQQQKPALGLSPLYAVCVTLTTVAAVAVTYKPGAGAHSHRHRVARAIGRQGSANSQRGCTDKQIPSENPGESVPFWPSLVLLLWPSCLLQDPRYPGMFPATG